MTCTTARSSAWCVRIHLGLAGEQLAGSEGGALVSRLGLEVDEALSEVRSIARGVPPVLAEHGLAIALRSASRWTAVPVCIVDGGVGRYPAAVESTVYFCCLEALQNVAKHGGPHVQATIVFGEADAALSFTIQDDGGLRRRCRRPGCRAVEPARARPGHRRDDRDRVGARARDARGGPGTGRSSASAAEPTRA